MFTIFYDFSKADWVGLGNYLLDSDFKFSMCFETYDVDEVWSIVRLIIYSGMDLFIPKVRLRSFQFPKWFTPELRHKQKCLKTLTNKYSQNQTHNNLCRKNVAELEFRQLSESAKASYEGKLVDNFASTKSSNIYRYINHLRKGGDIPSTVHNGPILATSDKDKASLFNQTEYFHSVLTVSSFSDPPIDESSDASPSIRSLEISESDVFNILSSLDTAKAKGLVRAS